VKPKIGKPAKCKYNRSAWAPKEKSWKEKGAFSSSLDIYEEEKTYTDENDFG